MITQDPLMWAMAFLIIFVGLLFYFTGRVTAGHLPAFRRIRAFESIKGFTGRAIEAGRALHLSLGTGSMANETTADSLAGLTVLDYLAKQGATTGVPPTVSMADPTVMLFAQNTMRKANIDDPEGMDEAYRNVRWMAPQPGAYAAGVTSLMNIDEVEANVMVGDFGDEYLLMGETAAGHIGGTSNPNTLPFIYASADDILLGEEIYAAGAYLQQKPAHIGSLLSQDTMRWIVAGVILIGIIMASLG